MKVDYTFNRETRNLDAEEAVCDCGSPILLVRVSWEIWHSVERNTLKDHLSSCASFKRRGDALQKILDRKAMTPKYSTAFEDSVAADSMDCREGWDDGSDTEY